MIQYFLEHNSIILQVTPINWVNLWATIGSIFVSVAVIVFNSWSTRRSITANKENIDKTLEATKETTDKTFQSKRIEERKAEIYKTLNELYGPLSQLRQKSALLYQKFKTGKADNTGEGRFSTLLYLLENDGLDEFSNNDKILLAEIIKIGRLCERLIQSKAGLIDNEDLRKKWFPLAAKHYLIIRLAYNGSLKGEVDLYKDSMFPTEIDKLIEQRIETLQKELKEINKINTVT